MGTSNQVIRFTLMLSDWMLHALHLGITLFCIFGWIFPPAREAHLALLALIAFSWFGVGRFIEGIGYCPVTDLQWRVKEQLGCRPNSSSFIKYQLEQLLGRELKVERVNRVTQIVFFISLAMSLYFNFLHNRIL